MESTNGFLYEAQVHYMCREGYQMQGSATLTCGPNGEWIGETPNCKGMFQELGYKIFYFSKVKGSVTLCNLM